MPQATVIIKNQLGLHARASARLVKLAETFDAEITLSRTDDSNVANGRDILELLQLAAGRGTEVIVAAEGNDGQAALIALMDLIESGFGETAIYPFRDKV